MLLTKRMKGVVSIQLRVAVISERKKRGTE